MIPDGVIEVFFIDIGVDSASNRTEYQEYFLRGKGGQYVGLTTLPPSCADLSGHLGASTSWKPHSLSSPVMGLLYLLYVPISCHLLKISTFAAHFKDRATVINFSALS